MNTNDGNKSTVIKVPDGSALAVPDVDERNSNFQLLRTKVTAVIILRYT